MKIKFKAVIFIAVIVAVIATAYAIKANGNQNKIVGYIYDSGTTVWSMAERHCPDGMDVRNFAREIEEINNIQNSTVYAHEVYKIPVYETESEYLDMNTVVGFDATEDGVLLHTNDGNGYYVEK